jgi:hypothetical protein
MQEMVIFYSWQSDTDEDLNRYFIRDCLKDAEKALNKQGSIQESIRVQHDTTGAGGTPAIADTIYKRIAASAMVIADVTFVGHLDPAAVIAADWSRACELQLNVHEFCKQPRTRRSKTPNPNVLLETGYAAHPFWPTHGTDF